MRRHFLMLCACIAAVFVACSSGDVAGRLADAVLELEADDVEACSEICNKIISDSTTFNSLTATQLCTLSELYVKMGDDEANDASATRCLARARSLATDSVDAFIRNSSAEIAVRLAVLDRVGSYLGIPRDSLGEVEDLMIDSIPTE